MYDFELNAQLVVVAMIAQNWSAREAAEFGDLLDHLIVLNIAPSEFRSLDSESQDRFNAFISEVLVGRLQPKHMTR